jgi:hypothetical protein
MRGVEVDPNSGQAVVFAVNQAIGCRVGFHKILAKGFCLQEAISKEVLIQRGIFLAKPSNSDPSVVE